MFVQTKLILFQFKVVCYKYEESESESYYSSVSGVHKKKNGKDESIEMRECHSFAFTWFDIVGRKGKKRSRRVLLYPCATVSKEYILFSKQTYIPQTC